MVCQSRSVTSTNTNLTVVVQLTVAADRAYTVGAQLAEALRSAAGADGVQLSVQTPEVPRQRVPAPLQREPELRILTGQRRILLRGRDVELTRLEYDLLLFLCRHPGRVHQRAALMSAVWKLEQPYRSRTIDVHVRRLRRKLGPDVPSITTVRGVGYRVDDTGQVRVEDGLVAVPPAQTAQSA